LPTRLTDALEVIPPDLRLQNDFAYGRDDPRGYQCPLGAHIRRANPRDSLEPGDQKEEFITNRHRLLRRGRSYSYAADGDGQERKGLLFMALCADLERQFEFVQHSWLNASTFHGLTDEGDPVAGPDKQRLDGKARSFTIPTSAGPLTLQDVHSWVSVHGGGYFFLPSLAALKYLATQASSRITSPAPAIFPLLNRPLGPAAASSVRHSP
jgi:deferrochelatase/peroxidase EfeB